MSVISFFSATHCHESEVVEAVRQRLGYGLLSHQALLSRAADRFGVPAEKLERSVHGPGSVFNRLTHERERNLIYLRAALAELLQPDDLVYLGFAGHLLPRHLTNVLRVCLVAGLDSRVAQAAKSGEADARSARRRILKEDDERKAWTLNLFGLGPWDKRLYDIILPTDTTSVDEAADLVAGHAGRPPVATTPEARQALADLLLATQVHVVLAQNGHDVDVDVSASAGTVTVTLNRYVIRLEHLKAELRELVMGVPGVDDMRSKLGPHFYPADRFDEILQVPPPKYLLVDDEKEFVLTLSQRLETRNIGSAVAYDGEEALSIVDSDTPDVMVLDLKMPGIDGMEVLRRVRRENPGTQVIILTGHGSEQEERAARDLGAFAYLEKPVDIDVLTDTMKRAYEKARAIRGGGA